MLSHDDDHHHDAADSVLLSAAQCRDSQRMSETLKKKESEARPPTLITMPEVSGLVVHPTLLQLVEESICPVRDVPFRVFVL